jgi:chemotaxis protein CheD
MAAMCHCLLAKRPNEKPSIQKGSSYAYMDLALEEMLKFFRRAGIFPAQLEVKLFGGADVLEVLAGPESVGRQNIHFAQRLIAHHGLRLVASDVGGQVGRNILFTTHTGGVRVQKMRSAATQQLAIA